MTSEQEKELAALQREREGLRAVVQRREDAKQLEKERQDVALLRAEVQRSGGDPVGTGGVTEAQLAAGQVPLGNTPAVNQGMTQVAARNSAPIAPGGSGEIPPSPPRDSVAAIVARQQGYTVLPPMPDKTR